MRIFDWKATRSGDCITVQGVTAEGQPFKLTQVASIEVRCGEVFAIPYRGEPLTLSSEPAPWASGDERISA